MPEDGSAKTARLHGSASLHLRTLNALHESLFAPQFHALERYGEASSLAPSPAEIVVAAKAVVAWHQRKEIEVAAELARRREAGSHPALIDSAARTLAFHREERVRIAAELTASDISD